MGSTIMREVFGLAILEKRYRYSSGLIYNLVCDIAEMLRAKITKDTVKLVCFTTKMYWQKTNFMFSITALPDGCLLSIETPGGDEWAERQLALMLTIADKMLELLPDKTIMPAPPHGGLPA